MRKIGIPDNTYPCDHRDGDLNEFCAFLQSCKSTPESGLQAGPGKDSSHRSRLDRDGMKQDIGAVFGADKVSTRRRGS